MAELRWAQTTAGMREAAVLLQQVWIVAASGLSQRQRMAYVAGLSRPESIVYPFLGNPLAARVENLSRTARFIEEGTPALHLPSAINWGASPKARRNKHGRYYLIIPFVHGTLRAVERSLRRGGRPRLQVMAEAVAARAQRLRPGQYLTAGPTRGRARHAPLAPYVPRTPANIRLLGHASTQEGLIRVPGAQRGGRGTYLTFRTLSQDSPYWHIPAQPGAHLIPEVIQAATPSVTRLLTWTLHQDIVVRLTSSVGVA